LLDDTCQVEVVATATDSETGLRLCAELRPDAAFLDVNLPGKDGVSLATQLAMLPQPPRLVFTTGNAGRATDAFRLEAVDYLLKPLDPEQVGEAVNRLLTYLRPFKSDSLRGVGERANGSSATDKMRFTGTANELLPVKDVDRDQIVRTRARDANLQLSQSAPRGYGNLPRRDGWLSRIGCRRGGGGIRLLKHTDVSRDCWQFGAGKHFGEASRNAGNLIRFAAGNRKCLQFSQKPGCVGPGRTQER
jgi:CheY-like chemotaxis protein